MIIIAIVLALALAGEAQAQDFAGGSGTASDPFLVADAAHLNSVRHHLTAYFRQTADIDLAAAPWNQDEGWLPIGTPDSPFEGRYDGDGRRVSGLTINRPNENDIGLFGATREGAEIISIQVEDVRVTGNERVGGLVGANNGSVSTSSAGGRVGGGWRVGGLVGENAGGTVSGCAAEVTVEPAASWSTWQFGGLVGRNGVEGLVENSHSDGSVTSDGELGGLVGTNEGTVTRCVSNAAVIGNWYFIGGLVGLNEGNISDSQAVGGVNLDVVSAPNGGYIGGLAGWNQGTIFLSYASGPVTATGGANAVIYGAGGLVGENTQQGSIQRCHADSTVSVNLGLAYYVGGLVGDNSGAITESHATGSVTSTSTQSYAIGGLVGDHNGLLEKSHASGPVTVGWDTVTGVHGYAVGGLVGDNGSNGTITQCHASGDVVVNAQYDGPTGGLIGTNRGTVSDSYATGDVFGDWRVGGLAGENFGGLTGCFAIGAVHGGSGVGGLVGLSSSNGRVGECYATGAVTGNQSVGGLAGSNLGTISECYALGRVTGHTEVGGLVGWNRSSSTLRGTIAVSYAAGAVVAEGEHVGGLVGRNDGDVEAAYWDLETTGQEESPGGQGRTTAQMIYPHDAETTYWEWDFQETWAEDVRSLRNGGYPYLRQLPPLSRTVIRSPFRSGTLVAGDVLRFSAGALDDAAATYLWDFDDGRTSVLRDPGLVGFPNPGEFQVICSVQMEVIETFRQEIRTFDVVEDTGDIPDLRVTDVRVPTDIATGSPAAITYTVQNLGQGPAGPSWVDKIYLSTDPFLDVDDTLLAEITIDRALEQGDTYQNTITVTLPVLEEGLYYLILSANDEWHLLERVRLNNLHAAPVTVRIPSLAPNDLFTSPYTAGFVEQYFRITATGGENLMLNLLDADPGLVAHVRFGALPTRATYDYRWTGGPLLIPLASAGDWYILVFGIIARDGDYQIGFEPSELVLTSHSPSSQGTGTDLQLILNGSGFMHPMVVELVSSHGAVYGAVEVNVDALTRATAFFPAGSVLPGIYDVRISRNGRQAQRPQSLEIIAAAQSRPKLEVDLILPSQLSYSRPATLYVEYANTGNVPMAAPLLVVTATQNDQPGALLTLNGDQLQAGVWSSATPQGFANAAQFLASGQTPGLLQPGETGRIPVYYAGWQRPWDMSDPPTLWYVYAIGSDDATAVNWEEMKHRMRPGYVTESAWDVIWQNFRTLAGDTWGDFIWMLSRDALYLYRQDRRVDDIDSLMAFSLRQAEGLAPLAVLAASTDVFVQGPGLPLIFERSYLQSISRRFEMGPLGRGWTHNWQVSLTAQVDGTLAIIDQTGTPRLFHPDRRYTGRYLAQPGDEGDLRQADGGYRLTEINGIVQFFTADGNLGFVEDTNGNRITGTYAGGVLTRLTHSSGGYLEIGYTGGLLTTVTDRHGRQVRYTYDGDYLVSHMTDDQRETIYQYHRNAGSAQHALAAVTLPDGVTRHFGYDALGRLIRIHRNADQEPVTLAYAGSGQVDMTNALGHTARFFFDEWGRLVKTENPLDEVMKYSFDAQGRPVAVTGPDGHVDQFRFDRRGNLVEMTDATRRSTRFAYSRNLNRLETVQNPAGIRTQYAFDPQGNQTATIQYDGQRRSWTYDADGNPTTWTNRRGQRVRYTFDAEGRLTGKVYEGTGYDAEYRYDARGNLVEAADSSGVTTFIYDDDDYLIRVNYPGNRWLQFSYDSAGRRATSRDQLGRGVNYHHDAAGRLSELTDENDTLLVAYAYDVLGRLAHKTMGNGVTAAYTYDPVGRLETLVNRDPDDGVLSSFAYTYDRRGRRVSMQTHYGQWSYAYDEVGQLVRAELASNDPQIPDQELIYTYDALGNRIRTTINGEDKVYSANLFNQYTQVGDKSYAHDADGNLIEEYGPQGSTVYTYDYENRLVGLARYDASGNRDVEYSYLYDAMGNRVSVTENGAQTQYVIDPSGMGDIVGAYDGSGNPVAHFAHGLGLVSSATGAGRNFYTFDPMGNTSALIDADGRTQNSYAYLPFGAALLQNQTVPNPFRFMGQAGVTADPSGWHHARARYYDAGLGRFTSMDPIGFGGGDVNLYRYVFNSPIDGFDPMGLSRLCGAIKGGLAVAGGVASVKSGLALTVGSKGLLGVVGAGIVTAGVSEISGGLAQIRDNYYGNELADATVQKSSAGLWEGVAYYGAKEASNVSQTLDTASKIAKETYAVTGLLRGLVKNAKSVAKSFAVNRFCAWNSQPVDPPIPPRIEPPPAQPGAPEPSIPPPGPPIRVSTVNAIDPNQKLGVAGYGERNFLPLGRRLSYRIDFENLATATAPAQVVTIRDPLSPHLDLESFEITGIGFGDVFVPVPPGLKNFATVVNYAFTDATYDFDIEVHIEAWLENGVFNLNLISIDPLTGLPPQDALVGFLPPENETGRGQGFVTYMVRHHPDLPSGTQIRNIADIQFDFGLTIATNQVDPLDPSKGTDPCLEALVTFDGLAPVSRMADLAPVTAASTFTVSWSGQDDPDGSGVGGYDLYVRENQGPWTNWLRNTASTSAQFAGADGVTYAFYAVATDNVGNREAKVAGVEASTRIDLTADEGEPPLDPPPPPHGDDPGDHTPEPPVETEITHHNQVVEAGMTLANRGPYDGVMINAGGIVNNYSVLSNLINHGTVNGGTVSGNSLNSGVLNQVTLAPGTLLNNPGGMLSGGVNNGHVFGGIIEGIFENNGLLSGTAPDGAPNPDYTLQIEPGTVVTGGTMEGEIHNMGALVDVTFGPGASILFLPLSHGEPGRLSGNTRFIDTEGLVCTILIPPDVIFPDSAAIAADGLLVQGRNLLDYAWAQGWDAEKETDNADLSVGPVTAVPEGYLLVGGILLSETGSQSTAAFYVDVPYASWSLPDDYSEDALQVLVFDSVQKHWSWVPSENTGDDALRISTTSITAYAVVISEDHVVPSDPDAPEDPAYSHSESSSGCFVSTLIGVHRAAVGMRFFPPYGRD